MKRKTGHGFYIHQSGELLILFPNGNVELFIHDFIGWEKPEWYMYWEDDFHISEMDSTKWIFLDNL